MKRLNKRQIEKLGKREYIKIEFIKNSSISIGCPLKDTGYPVKGDVLNVQFYMPGESIFCCYCELLCDYIYVDYKHVRVYK